MKPLSSILFIILFCISCAEPELVLDNELDPENPDYDPPETTIEGILTNQEDEVISQELEVEWYGNVPDMEFKQKFDNEDWTDWNLSTQTVLDYLDEGPHMFLVKSRYLSGSEEEYPDTLNFTVNAIQNPALRIYPLKTEATLNQEFSVDIMVENVNAVAGAGIKIDLSGGLSFTGDTLTPGTFFTTEDQDGVPGYDVLCLYSISDDGAGTVTLDLNIAAYADAQTDYFDGEGVIATLYITGNSSETDGQITFGNSTTLRNANNDLADLDELYDGTVNVE